MFTNSVIRGFDAIGYESKRALFALCSSRFVGDNKAIYLQGDEASHLYFVISGYVRLSYSTEDGSSPVLHEIASPGKSFGELAVLDGREYCDTATGVGSPIISSVSISNFYKLCERYIELNWAFAAVGQIAIGLRRICSHDWY